MGPITQQLSLLHIAPRGAPVHEESETALFKQKHGPVGVALAYALPTFSLALVGIIAEYARPFDPRKDLKPADVAITQKYRSQISILNSTTSVKILLKENEKNEETMLQLGDSESYNRIREIHSHVDRPGLVLEIKNGVKAAGYVFDAKIPKVSYVLLSEDAFMEFVKKHTS